MVTVNVAFTAPINPPSATPTLTEPQVWAGLQRKVKRAYEFVPIIEKCEVISEEGNVVTREATFSAGWQGPGSPSKTVREVCTHMAPSRVDFMQPDGSNISNIVSHGPDGELLMTYAFEWRNQEGDDLEALRTKYIGMAKGAVVGSIETIRRLVKEGEIQ